MASVQFASLSAPGSESYADRHFVDVLLCLQDFKLEHVQNILMRGGGAMTRCAIVDDSLKVRAVPS